MTAAASPTHAHASAEQGKALGDRLRAMDDDHFVAEWLYLSEDDRATLTQAERSKFIARHRLIMHADRGSLVATHKRNSAPLDRVNEQSNAAPTRPEAGPETDWPQPVPFDSVNTLEIPAALLPSTVGSYVAALCEHTETPDALGVMIALAVLSTAARGRVEVEIDGGHREPANLFVLVALPSGNRKSSVVSGLSGPLVAWEREQGEILKPQIAQQRSRRRSEEALIEQRRRRLHTIQGSELRFEIEAIAKAESELPAVSALPQLFANDATPESLAALLDEQAGVFGMLSDEGGILDVLAGLYTNGQANVDVVLKGWDRGSCRIRRRDRQIDMNPSLTLGLAVQPATLASLAGKRAFHGRGLLERFLYAIPASTLGYRHHDRPAPTQEIVQTYADAIRHVLSSEDKRVLRLSAQATADLREFRRAVEAMLRPGGELSEFTGWGSKLPGQLARVAGLMHLVERPTSAEIQADTMTRALELGVLLVPHALAALTEMGLDPATADARRCWRWIAKRGTFTRGNLTLAMRHTMNAARIHAALKVLAGRYLIDSEDGAPSPGTRERTFRVNPNAGGSDGLA